MAPRQIEILQVPSNLGLKPSGVERAPAVLAAAGLDRRLGAARTATIDCPAFDPERDAATGLLNPLGLVSVARALAAAVATTLERGAFPVVIGGDCSILLGAMLALRRRGEYGLLHVDGHADFQHPSQEPNGEAASLDLALVTGRGPRAVVDIDGLAPLVRDEDTAHLGYRAEPDAFHLDLHIRESAILVRDLADVRTAGIDACINDVLARVARPDLHGFWLHFDVDVLDDALMPAVDYRQPGGLDWSESASVLRAAHATGRVAGLQVTIYNPNLDGDGYPRATQLVDLLADALK